MMRELTRILNGLEGFREPKIDLEQYETPPHIIIDIMKQLTPLKGLTVADFGSGTGLLGAAALILSAKKVIFVEKDDDAVQIMKKNIEKLKEKFEIGDYKIIRKDLKEITIKADVVIMNPPFGTKEKHADYLFIKKAMDASKTIATIHKTSTLDFIKKIIVKNNFIILWEKRFRFELKNRMKHHTKEKKYTDVTALIIKAE